MAEVTRVVLHHRGFVIGPVVSGSLQNLQTVSGSLVRRPRLMYQNFLHHVQIHHEELEVFFPKNFSIIFGLPSPQGRTLCKEMEQGTAEDGMLLRRHIGASGQVPIVNGHTRTYMLGCCGKIWFIVSADYRRNQKHMI